jgi:drug/metabolite transporter (DMT)-like permease
MKRLFTQKRRNMNKIVSLVLLVGGVVLTIMGINAANSFNSGAFRFDSLGPDVSRFFNGSPPDKAVWLLIGGALAGAMGLVSMFRNWKKA